MVNCPLELQCSTSWGGGLAKVQCSSHFYRGVPPKVLVTSGSIATIESQIEWVYFKLKLSQKWKHFLRSHSEKLVSQ